MPNLQDKINDAFNKVLLKEKSKGYTQYIKSINKQLIENVDNLTPAKVKSIIKSQEFNIGNMALIFTLQNAILLILSNKKKAREHGLYGVIALMGMYSLRKPERFVKKIVKVVNNRGLNESEKKAFAIVKDFERSNAKVVKAAKAKSIRNLQRSIEKSKISKRIIRDYKQGLEQGKSVKGIKNGLIKKYNQKSNIERALTTELHKQGEAIRITHAKDIGYTHKIWRTQQDSRVRETCFHNSIKNKQVPIDSDFRACGMVAAFPGDDRLPPNESIRCRCYLDYK